MQDSSAGAERDARNEHPPPARRARGAHGRPGRDTRRTRQAAGPCSDGPGYRPARWLLAATAGVLSLVVLTGTALLWGLKDYTMGEVERVAAFQGASLADRPPDSPGMNILMVGSDRRAGLSPAMRRKLHVGRASGRRSDTMILAHISADGNRAVLVSLPRDWYVTVPEHREDGERVPARKRKLNAAFAIGGADLTVATVEENTGVRIDHYMEVSFLGFVRVVNALGGIDVCVPKPVDDPKSGLSLPAGTSHLNGVRSLKYVRARKTLGTGSDLERINRQQEFLGTMMQRALATGTLLNPVKVTDLLDAVLAAVTVDRAFSASTLRRLATIGRGLRPERISFVTVPIADPGYRTDEGKSVVLADEKKTQRLFGRIRADEPASAPRRQGGGAPGDGSSAPPVTIPPQRIEIEVYNDAEVTGLAARAARDLREVGFLMEGAPRNAPPPNDAGTTVIQHGPNRADSARTVAAALPGAEVERVAELGDDVQVLLGSDYDGARDVQAHPGPAAGGSDAPASGKSPFDADLAPRSAAAKPCQ